MNLSRWLCLLLIGFVFVPAPGSAAGRTGMTRGEIKSLPITERPNRPGHFYGNTVRRSTQRRRG